ncbi:MAG: hypothetical protein ACRED0_05490, partial [Gammaproteobacteria bacterium]
WGYKRIAVIARREGLSISNKQVYRVFKAYGLVRRQDGTSASTRTLRIMVGTGPYIDISIAS